MYDLGRGFHESSVSRMAKAILRSYPHSKSAAAVLSGLQCGSLDAIAPYHLVPFGDYDIGSTDFSVEYMAYNLLRKCVDLPGSNPESRCDRAIEKFLSTEKACKAQNLRMGFHTGYSTWRGDPLDRTLETTFSVAREKIAGLLGTFSWDEPCKHFGFSNGASTGLARKHGSPYFKFSGKPEVTRSAALLATCAIWHSPLWRERMHIVHGKHSDPQTWVTIVDGSRITTVPKTADVDRVIAIEPDLNMYLQRGIGAVIRRRLLRVDIDLNDQTRNQRLALIGSKTGSLATIDLKSASDSISLELCRRLLPHDWYEALALTRCERGVLPNGKDITFEKISSMGNGYTFELESLIFWALTKASCTVNECEDDRIGIYGDDIICHASYADHLVDLLGACGFETNSQKSFISGPFRESCGKHYYLGSDVTPFNIKSTELSGDFTDMLHVRNSYYHWARRTQLVEDEKLLHYLTRQIPLASRLPVPASLGLRAGIHGDKPRSLPLVRHLHGHRIRYFCYKRTRCVPYGFSAYLAGVHAKSSGSASEVTSGVEFSFDVGVRELTIKKMVISWWD